jgi:hypothetical protein
MTMTYITKLYSAIRYTLFFICLAFLWMSCDEAIKLELGEYTSKVVIEAQVTNLEGYQYAKISRTTDFYTSGKTPRVTNAIVTVTDDIGNVFDFVHNPSDKADSMGYYLPLTPFVGEVGRTYHLRVELDGEVYEAKDKLLPVTSVDKLTYEIDEFERKDPEVEGRFYNVLVFVKEPQDEKNFYLFKFFRNDSLTYASETDIYYSDDTLLGENIEGLETPLYYRIGDTFKMEMYSISRTGYVFYNDLSNVLNQDAGGMFGSIPASPRTNLSNGALGFFQVSAVDISSIKIE